MTPQTIIGTLRDCQEALDTSGQQLARTIAGSIARNIGRDVCDVDEAHILRIAGVTLGAAFNLLMHLESCAHCAEAHGFADHAPNLDDIVQLGGQGIIAIHDDLQIVRLEKAMVAQSHLRRPPLPACSSDISEGRPQAGDGPQEPGTRDQSD